MKFAGAATLGYFSLSGVSAISGMAPSVGGPIPNDICGTLEDALVAGDFPVDSDPGRYFVKYNRQNRETFRAFVKCAPYSHISSYDDRVADGFDNQHTLDDIKARRRYAAMFVRKDRMGLYKCDRLTGADDGWVMKAGWDIKECPAIEGGKWAEFFPPNAEVRIPQEVTEWENPYEGYHDNCPSDMSYYHDGAWHTSPCDDENFAVMADDSCVAMTDESFVEITTLGNGLRQFSWADNPEVGVKGIPCGYKFEEVELTLNGKVRHINLSNENSTLTWMPNMLDDLSYLRSFTLDLTGFQNFEPNFFAKLMRPKKMQSLVISGTNIDLDHQWSTVFFGRGDGFGQLIELDISDNTGITAVKPEWLNSFISIENLYITSNPNLAEIPGALISRFSSGNNVNFDISDNAIASWPTDDEGNAVAFGAMTDNMHIDISGNSLASVPSSVFEGIDSANEGDGWSVDMDGNNCTPIDNPCTAANTCGCNE